MRLPLRFGAAVFAAVATACTGTPGRAMEEVVPAGTAGFALEVTPAPRRAELSDRVWPVDLDRDVQFESHLAGAEEYVLCVEERDGRAVVRIAAAGPAGRRRALATLSQLVADHAGRTWVRVGLVADGPALPLRGSKRPLPFEVRYGANFAWERIDDDPAARRPEVVATFAPGGVLDATEAGVDRVAAFFAEKHAEGVRRFAIRFDDVGFGLTPASRDRFGSYPRALVVFLRACRERLKAIDPAAVLYFLPQTYWTNDPRLPRFALDLGAAGGLPPDLGLVVTGPEVVSREIRAADVAAARRAFGLTARKALVYDNLGREGDHGPLLDRDPALAAEVDGVFGERGEILHRITRLDWNWNPAGYDPVRSHLLACREVFGAAAAPAVSRLVREWDRLAPAERERLFAEARAKILRPPHGPVDPAEELARIRRDLEARPAP